MVHLLFDERDNFSPSLMPLIISRIATFAFHAVDNGFSVILFLSSRTRTVFLPSSDWMMARAGILITFLRSTCHNRGIARHTKLQVCVRTQSPDGYGICRLRPLLSVRNRFPHFILNGVFGNASSLMDPV